LHVPAYEVDHRGVCFLGDDWVRRECRQQFQRTGGWDVADELVFLGIVVELAA